MPSRSCKTLSALAAAMLLAGHSAWAQDAAAEAALPPASAASAARAALTDGAEDASAAPELPTVTVTASSIQTTTGMALTVKETPQSVTVMQQEPLRAQGITSMKDALKTTTGINVIRDGNRVRYQSRGFYINQMEEDGMASTVTAGNNGNPYRDPQSMTDLAIYDHIEVVRGATGLTQANSEPGGTINAVRKKPTTARQASVDASADHRGSVRLMGDISGSLNEARTVRGRMVAVGERKDSFKRSVDSHTGLLYGVADVQAGPSTLLTAGAMYQRVGEVPDTAGIPMGVGGVDAGLPRDTFLGLDWNRSRFTKKNVFAEAEHDINDDWRFSAKLNHIKSDSTSKFGAIYNGSTSYEGLAPGGTLSMQNMQNYVNDGRQSAFQANLSGKVHAAGRTHDVFATYTYSREKTDTRWRRVRDSTAFAPSPSAEAKSPSPTGKPALTTRSSTAAACARTRWRWVRGCTSPTRCTSLPAGATRAGRGAASRTTTPGMDSPTATRTSTPNCTATALCPTWAPRGI